MARVDGANEPDAQGADDRASGGADWDAVAAVGSDELTLDNALRHAALDYLARDWGFDSWRAYATFDLDAARGTGTAESRKVFDLVTAMVKAVMPTVTEQLGILETEVDDLQGELNDVRQVLAELGVPVNPMLSLRRQVKYAIKDLRVELAAIRTQLREVGVDGTQYDDIDTLTCVQQLADARDAAIENWGRCHRRHRDLEAGLAGDKGNPTETRDEARHGGQEA